MKSLKAALGGLTGLFGPRQRTEPDARTFRGILAHGYKRGAQPLPLSCRSDLLRLALRRPRIADRFGGQHQAPPDCGSVAPERVERRVLVVPVLQARKRRLVDPKRCEASARVSPAASRARLISLTNGRSSRNSPWRSKFAPSPVAICGGDPAGPWRSRGPACTLIETSIKLVQRFRIPWKRP